MISSSTMENINILEGMVCKAKEYLTNKVKTKPRSRKLLSINTAANMIAMVKGINRNNPAIFTVNLFSTEEEREDLKEEKAATQLVIELTKLNLAKNVMHEKLEELKEIELDLPKRINVQVTRDMIDKLSEMFVKLYKLNEKVERLAASVNHIADPVHYNKPLKINEKKPFGWLKNIGLYNKLKDDFTLSLKNDKTKNIVNTDVDQLLGNFHDDMIKTFGLDGKGAIDEAVTAGTKMAQKSYENSAIPYSDDGKINLVYKPEEDTSSTTEELKRSGSIDIPNNGLASTAVSNSSIDGLQEQRDLVNSLNATLAKAKEQEATNVSTAEKATVSESTTKPAELEKLRKDIDSANTTSTSLKDLNRQNEEELQKLKTEKEALQAEMLKAQEEYAHKQADIKEALYKELTQVKANLQGENSKLAETTKNIKSVQNEQEIMRQSIADTKKAMDALSSYVYPVTNATVSVVEEAQDLVVPTYEKEMVSPISSSLSSEPSSTMRSATPVASSFSLPNFSSNSDDESVFAAEDDTTTYAIHTGPEIDGLGAPASTYNFDIDTPGKAR